MLFLKLITLQFLSVIPNSLIEELQRFQKSLIWHSSRPKVSHKTLCNNFENGGLKHVHISFKIISLQCSRLRKLCDENFHEWKIILSHLINKYFRKSFKFHSCFSFDQKLLYLFYCYTFYCDTSILMGSSWIRSSKKYLQLIFFMKIHIWCFSRYRTKYLWCFFTDVFYVIWKCHFTVKKHTWTFFTRAVSNLFVFFHDAFFYARTTNKMTLIWVSFYLVFIKPFEECFWSIFQFQYNII